MRAVRLLHARAEQHVTEEIVERLEVIAVDLSDEDGLVAADVDAEIGGHREQARRELGARRSPAPPSVMSRAVRFVMPSRPGVSSADPASNTTRNVTMGELVRWTTMSGASRSGSRAGAAACASPPSVSVIGGYSRGAGGGPPHESAMSAVHASGRITTDLPRSRA
jgi:hypothetical protein